jgi:dTDP-glucose 4,6-dehydratase
VNLLVTGGAGFIGSNFVRRRRATHPADRLVVYDALTYAGNLGSLEGLLDGDACAFVRGDICDAELLKRTLAERRIEAIVHFAAESHVDRSILSAGDFVRTNVLGTATLLEQARAHGVARFVHVSTDEVYGSLGPSGLFSEETPYAPNSPYAASKAAADHLVRASFHTYGLPALITNCSNNYGPLQFPEKLIPLMLLNALDGRSLPVYGDGGQVRDWLHVEDHCAGILLVLAQGRLGEKYNIGGGNERTNLEIVDRICDAVEQLRPAGTNPALKGGSYRNLKRFVPDRPGHDRRYAIDATKIRRELGWAPRHRFEHGLEATARWYLEHREWCEQVQASYTRERLGHA